MALFLLLLLHCVFHCDSLNAAGSISILKRMANRAPFNNKNKALRHFILSKSKKSAVAVACDSRISMAFTQYLGDHAKLSLLSDLPNHPKLIVLDLDNTIWTPELYQLPRRLQQQRKSAPVANHDVRLFPDVFVILQFLSEQRIPLAIASRTSKIQWAQNLLDDFQVPRKDGTSVALRSFFDHIEIVPGSKKQHFSNLRQATTLSYGEMLFFDDDAQMNLEEVSSQLGVLCCHTPQGLTLDYFCKALHQYNNLKRDHASGHWMGYILNSKNLDISEDNAVVNPAIAYDERTLSGNIKFYSTQKRFGFVVDTKTNQEYFVHESKIPAGVQLQAGDTVNFKVNNGSGNRPSAVIISNTASNDREKSARATGVAETISMKCFTMSQPFAALLLNRIKTVESRNGPMFADVPSGTQFLLHCGQRDWNDMESYKEIMLQNGFSQEQIEVGSRLPKGFYKGMIIGRVTIGWTWSASERERRGKDLQRRVLAPHAGIGRYCAEITQAEWLKKPFKTRGNAGIYDVDLPKDCLRDTD